MKTTTIELADSELMILMQLLIAKITRKARAGIDTNALPETALNVKLLNARAAMLGQRPVL